MELMTAASLLCIDGESERPSEVAAYWAYESSCSPKKLRRFPVLMVTETRRHAMNNTMMM
jgi:hypothetical protein